MIDEAFAKKQLLRLSGLDFFPKETAALTELRLAIQAADNDSIAESVISEWMAMQRAAPKPADLRVLIYDKNSTIQRGPCPSCCGSHWVTAWFLVQYRQDGFTVDKKNTHRLHDFDCEKAQQFSEKIAASGVNQAILTAAVPCRCYAREAAEAA